MLKSIYHSNLCKKGKGKSFMENVEIERKWLLDEIPPLAFEEQSEMEQGYIVFSPTSVRIRKEIKGKEISYILNFKSKGTLERIEIEQVLSAEKYEALKKLVVGPMAYKKHYTHLLPTGEILELNQVDRQKPEGFCYAEVEFESVEKANAFIPPEYLGREVTQEKGYTMAAYCKRLAEK